MHPLLYLSFFASFLFLSLCYR